MHFLVQAGSVMHLGAFGEVVKKIKALFFFFIQRLDDTFHMLNGAHIIIER